MSSMGERLKKIRLLLEFRQQQMADKINISSRAWQTYERNEKTPGSNIIKSLCDLGFNGHWILTGEGSIKNTSTIIDEQLLETVIQSVEEFLQRNNATLDPDKKAQLIVLIYEEVADDDDANVHDYMKYIKLAI